MTEKSQNKSEKGEKKSYFKYVMGVVLLLLVFWMGSYAYQAYRYAALEKTLKEQTGYTVTLDEVEGKLLVSGEVRRFEDEQKILALILKEVDIPVDNQLKMSLTDMMDIFSTRDENLSNTLQDDVLSRDSRYKKAFKNLNDTLETREKAYREKIAVLEESLEGYADKLEVLQKRFESYLEEEAHRKAEIKRLKRLHQQILSALQNSQWLGYYLDPGEGTLDFADSRMFDAGSMELSVESRQTLSSHYTVLIKEMMKVEDARKYLKAIVIEGHTDSSGTAVQNQRISQERAETVKDLFVSLEITRKYQLSSLLIAKGMSNHFPMMKNGKEDQSASRRIKIKFDLDTIQIEKEIDRLLND